MKKTKIILGIALVASVLGWLLEISDGAGDPYPAEPLYILGIAALIPSAIVITVRPLANKAWARFATWWLVVSAAIIWINPLDNGGDWMPLFSIDQKQITWILAVLMLLIGLIIAFWPRRR